jgi:hypothetical protein
MYICRKLFFDKKFMALPLCIFSHAAGNPDKRMFRRMGYFDDQGGIIRRYRRERERWDAHLRNTRQFALQSMRGKGCKSAAVLGSGWLLDVPLEELSQNFEKVCLYDVRHPVAAAKMARSLGNIEGHTCDISCFARPVYRYARHYRNGGRRPPISVILPDAAPDLDGFDFVFSCNVLNQLDILLTDYLLRFFELGNEEISVFRSSVQQHHINLLPLKRSCLVADYEEITLTPDGREISRRASVYGPVVQRADARRWTWEFDTKMTYYADRQTFFNVLGVEI